MLGCEIVEKSKIAFRARAPGRRNPHSSSSPGKPDTWQRGVGDPMAGTWRDAKCKLPRRSSPSSKDRATGEPDDAKVSSPVRRGADGKGRSRLPVTADAGGMVSDFVLGSYVPSSKPKTKSHTWQYSVTSESPRESRRVRRG